LKHPKNYQKVEYSRMIKEIIQKLIVVATIISSIYFIRWIGLKGVIGLTLGMLIMAYLILSDNFALYGILKILTGKSYENNIIKEEIRD
jgi:hypothetical protein